MATTITATVSPTTGPVQLVASKAHGTAVCLSQARPHPQSPPASASTSASASVSLPNTQQDTSHTSSPNSSTIASSDAQQPQNFPSGIQSAPSGIATTQPAPPTSNTTVPQQRPKNGLRSVIAGASLNNILCFLALVVAVVYGALQTSYVIWTGRNDARESCRDDQALGISSDYCRKILSSGVQAPRLGRRSISHAVPFVLTSKAGHDDHAILTAVTAIVLTLAVGISSAVWLHSGTRLPVRLVVSVVRVAYNLIAPITAELGRYTFEKLSGTEVGWIKQTSPPPEQLDNEINPLWEETDQEEMSGPESDMIDTHIHPTRITNFVGYSEESLVEGCPFLSLSESTEGLPIIVSAFSENYDQLEISAAPPDGGPMIELNYSHWWLYDRAAYWFELFFPSLYFRYLCDETLTAGECWCMFPPSRRPWTLPGYARKRSESLPDNRLSYLRHECDIVDKGNKRRNKRRNSEIETSGVWQGTGLPFSSSTWLPHKQAWWFPEHEEIDSGRDTFLRSELDGKEIEEVLPPLKDESGEEEEAVWPPIRFKKERKAKTHFTDQMLWDVAKRQIEMLQLEREGWGG